MSSYNYNTLLQYLDISHAQFIIMLIIIFLISSVVYFFYKLGLLTSIKFSQVTLPESQLIYVSYQGSYDMIQSSFGIVMNEMNTVFKVSQPFGMYYDNPKQVQNPDQSRAILGCFVNKIQTDKIPLFLSKFKHYRHKKISNTTLCIGTTYPFFNALSMILIITRVYPRLSQEVRRSKIEKSVGILQVYRIIEDRNQHVQIMMPLQNLQEFDLWYPPSQNLSESNNKKEL